MSYGALPGNLSDCAVANLRAGRAAAGIVTGVCTPGDLRVGNAAVVVVDQIVDVAGIGRHDETITHIRGDDRAADDAEGRRLHPVSTIEDRPRIPDDCTRRRNARIAISPHEYRELRHQRCRCRSCRCSIRSSFRRGH